MMTRDRKMHRAKTLGAGLAVASVLVASCGAGNGGTGGTALQFQEVFAPGNAFADATQAYGDAVSGATDGGVTFDYHWSNSVVASNQVAGAMRDGLLDMARLQPPGSPADFPVTNWLASAAYQSAPAFPAGLLQQIGAHLEFAMSSPELEAELDQLGIRYIAPLALVQNYDLLCRDRIDTLDDFRGTPIRAAGEAWVNETDNLGAQPVTLLAEEIYEGYQRGVVDCVMTYPTHYVDAGLWELGGYHVPVSLTGWNQDAIAISAATWDSLSPEARRELLANVDVWIETFVRQQLEKYYQFATEASEHGVELLEPNPDVQARIDQYHEGLRDSMVASAPPVVGDPGAVLDQYADLHGKWLGIVEGLGFEAGGQSLQEWAQSLDEEGTSPSDIDLRPWLDQIMSEIYEPLIAEQQ